MDPVFGALGFSFIKLMYAIYFSPPLSFPLVTALNFTQIKSQSDNYGRLKNGFFFFNKIACSSLAFTVIF